MPRTIPGFLVLLIPLSMLSGGCGTPGSASLARLSAFEGGVRVNGNAAEPAHQLDAGDLLELVPGATCLLKFADGTQAKLVGDELGTSMILRRHNSGNLVVTALNLVKGAVGMDVAPQKRGLTKVEVQTANCTTSIEGTRLKVVSSLTGTTVAVASGVVSVRSADASQTTTLSGYRQVRVPITGLFGEVGEYSPQGAEDRYFPPRGPVHENRGTGGGN